MQAQAPLGFGTGQLASYNFSPNIEIAGTYGPPVAQLSPFFHMGLGGAMANDAVPGAAGLTGVYHAPAYGQGTTLAHKSQASAIDRSNGFPLDDAVDGANAAPSLLGPLAVAGPSMGPAGPDVDRPEPQQTVANVDDWFDFDALLGDVQPAGTGSGTTPTPTTVALPAINTAYVVPNSPPAAVPAVSPSVAREASPDIDGEQPTAWLEGGQLFWRLTGPDYQSGESIARTSSSVASPGWGVGPSPATSKGPLIASGYSYAAYASSAQHSEQLGLHVQGDNTVITPAVTGLQPEIVQPATKSRKPAARASTSRKPAARVASSDKEARSSKVRNQKTTKAQTSAAIKARARAPKIPKNPFPRIPWEQTERGRMCGERGLTKDTPGPFQCFVCAEHQTPGATKQYTKWESFKSHVGRCAPVQSMLPRCHFCHDRIAAYGRPHQMERHLVGYDGYPACEVLAKLVGDGKRTHDAIGAWLKKNKRPILPEFLGRRLAKAFYHAVYDKYERDKVADLTPQHRKPKEECVDEDDDEDDDEE